MHKQLLSSLLMVLFSGFLAAQQNVVEQRQALFNKVENGTESLEKLIEQGEMSAISVQAEMLSKHVAELAHLFPNQSGGKGGSSSSWRKWVFPEGSKSDGRSSSKIWKNWDDFSARLSRLESAYVQMYAAASEEDVKRVKQAFKLADSSCRSCHMKYRSLW
ncbi:c-type cytochrome [Marinomonas sp. PE14-40]|uniref:c-type cytochrome n=1 Tax=Marinomonas sp. PE14-40 TaxID=3060621 RepID=UPI003F67EC4E